MYQMPDSRENKILLKVSKEQIKLLKPFAESVASRPVLGDVERSIVTRGARRLTPQSSPPPIFLVADFAASGEVGLVPLPGGRPAVTYPGSG